MPSEQGWKEFKEMGQSAQVREEFRQLEAASRATQARMTLDHYVSFLTGISRAFSTRASHPFVPYTNVLL